MIQAIAVDDEPPALQVIKSFCDKTDLINLQMSFNKPMEALQYVSRHPVDLLFLDINMPSLSGIDLYKSLPRSAAVIFTTAYSNYAVEGFELNAVDYLVKPFTLERFLQAVGKANERHQYQHSSQAEEAIVVRVDYSFLKISLDSILYLESIGDYIKIHLTNGRPAVTRITMKTMADMLPAKQFVRIHRSYIVSLPQVTRVRSKLVEVDGKELPLSSRYEEEFIALFTNRSRVR